MISFSLSFFLGVLILQTFASLPSMLSLLILTAIMFALFTWRKHIPFSKEIIAFLLGFLWVSLHAMQVLAWQLPHTDEGQPKIVKVRILNKLATNSWGTQYHARLLVFKGRRLPLYLQPKINLYAANKQLPLLQAGEEWQLQVRLKRSHGLASPLAYDTEAANLVMGIRAIATIVVSNKNKLLKSENYFFETLREKINANLIPQFKQFSAGRLLPALITGERSGLTFADWQILQRTGTNHLLAIGGLHIGFVVGFIYLLTYFLVKRIPYLPLYVPAQKISLLTSFVVGLIYCLLSGLHLPTLRALIMLSLFTYAAMSKRVVNPWSVWCLALFFVLLAMPLTVLSSSFWLSFGTIALLIYALGGRPLQSGWRVHWLHPQWVIGIGLIPLTLYCFYQYSFVSLLANTLCIPWLGFVVLPLTLANALLYFCYPKLAILGFKLANLAWVAMWQVLTYLSTVKFANFHLAIPTIGLLICSCIGVLLFLLPKNMPGKALSFLWLLPCLTYSPLQLEPGSLKFTLLDVGEGLATVIQTASHTLIYDTGLRTPNGSDMGERIVLPYLYANKITTIDKIVISHADNDHSGGLASILAHMPTTEILTSIPSKFPTIATDFCQAGKHWQWDKIEFEFLYPYKPDHLSQNNDSCVLKITAGQNSILLPGDIEKAGIKNLLKQQQDLSTTILIAAHHGSKTSAPPEFIAALNPKIVLYSVGYRNRYHFPHPSVMAAYKKMGAIDLQTDKLGTLSFILNEKVRQIQFNAHRLHSPHYWQK